MHDTITLNNKKYALIPFAEYQKLVKNGGNAPSLPPRNSRGNYPALAVAEATIARTIVKRRVAAVLTQRALAELAKIRVETLNRAERGSSCRTFERFSGSSKRCDGRNQ